MLYFRMIYIYIIYTYNNVYIYIHTYTDTYKTLRYPERCSASDVVRVALSHCTFLFQTLAKPPLFFLRYEQKLNGGRTTHVRSEVEQEYLEAFASFFKQLQQDSFRPCIFVMW